MYSGVRTVSRGLIYGYDTGYPLVSQNHESYRFYLGKPTLTEYIGPMLPPGDSGSTFFTSSDTSQSNLHGTVWDWSYYPNSNISTDGGMEWLPNYEGPGFVGAWKMKKRAGGNSESNFSGNAPGAINSNNAYTVSVWCKTDQSSMARIHLNTTKDGSSYWGYASSNHTGGGGWERLSVTIPAGSGNTSINTIRCQCNGTTVNADAYWRNYQVEQNSQATPFLYTTANEGNSRTNNGSLIDLTRTNNISLTNVSFDSNGQITFDGTNDIINTGMFSGRNPSTDTFTIEAIVKSDTTTGTVIWVDATGNGSNQRLYCAHAATGTSNPLGIQGSAWSTGGAIYDTDYHHYVIVMDGSTATLYNNGVSHSTKNYTSYTLSGELNVGGRSSYRWNGKIPVFKLYDRALSAEEVKLNYRGYKKRFNL